MTAFQQRPDRLEAPRETAAAPAFDPWDVPAAHGAQPPFAYATPPDPTALLPWIDDVLALGSTGAEEAGPTTETRRAPPPQVAEVEAKPTPKPSTTSADTTPKPRQIPPHLKNDPHWTALLHGPPPSERWGPSSVQLPPKIVKALDEAWARTQRDGREHGGNLVRKGQDYAGRYTGRGTTHSFPSDERLTDGKEFVGVYHTHPLDHKTTQDETFSDGDVASLTEEGNRIAIMRTGDQTRMLARTKEFEAKMNAAEDPEEFAAGMQDTYNAAYLKALGGDPQVGARDPKRHAAALEAATLATANAYNLLYFSGKGANLQRRGGPPKPTRP